MSLVSVYIHLLKLSFVFILVKSASICPHTCVHLDECPKLLALTKELVLDPDEFQLLQESRCGSRNNKTRVCCPQNTTLTNTNTAEKDNLLPRPGELGCGYSMSNRIMSGSGTHIDEHPWMALLEYTDTANAEKVHLCSGTLISQRYVLTAAHCVHLLRDMTLTSVRLGEWDISTSHDCEIDTYGFEDCADEPVDVPVEQVIIHEAYTLNNPRYDIALIRLAKSVESSEFIVPICLPQRNGSDKFPYDQVKRMNVVTWGRTGNVTKSDRKFKGTAKSTSFDECARFYEDRWRVRYQRDSHICVAGKIGASICKGGSGSPLVADVRGEPDYYAILGVVSFGHNACGFKGWPGVYTKVEHYLDWIREHIEH